MQLANKSKLENLAFPAISTGVYGYPPEEAAEVRQRVTRGNTGAVKHARITVPQCTSTWPGVSPCWRWHCPST